MHHWLARLLASLANAAYPIAAFAEVSDKEPSICLFWRVSLVTAMLCLVGARIRPWVGVIILAPVLLWFVGSFLDMHSWDVEPYLLAEQGIAYFLHAYAALGLILCALLIGYLWNRHGRP